MFKYWSPYLIPGPLRLTHMLHWFPTKALWLSSTGVGHTAWWLWIQLGGQEEVKMLRLMGNCPGLEQLLSAESRWTHKWVQRDRNKTFSKWHWPEQTLCSLSVQRHLSEVCWGDKKWVRRFSSQSPPGFPLANSLPFRSGQPSFSHWLSICWNSVGWKRTLHQHLLLSGIVLFNSNGTVCAVQDIGGKWERFSGSMLIIIWKNCSVVMEFKYQEQESQGFMKMIKKSWIWKDRVCLFHYNAHWVPTIC